MINFLTLDDVLERHVVQIARYGGSAGVRDRGMLESALAQPEATFGGQFLHADLYEMAAAYLFHMVMNHPFIDGNKRTGTEADLLFLDINGLEDTASDEELVELTLSVALGQCGKKEIAQFFREHTRPIG